MLTSSNVHGEQEHTMLVSAIPRQRRARLSVREEAALRAVVAMIELFPERWDQTKYLGVNPQGDPTFCVAGWTCQLAGFRARQIMESDCSGRALVQTAATLLGLDEAQAEAVFSFGCDPVLDVPHPTVEQLKAHLTAVTGVDFTPQVHAVYNAEGEAA